MAVCSVLEVAYQKLTQGPTRKLITKQLVALRDGRSPCFQLS